MFEISKDTPFECSVNGEKIQMRDLVSLYDFYRVSCTAEYINENYGIEISDAMKLGYEVRNMMDDVDISEDEAIQAVFTERGINPQGR